LHHHSPHIKQENLHNTIEERLGTPQLTHPHNRATSLALLATFLGLALVIADNGNSKGIISHGE
jgi:hypothetical protein